MVSQLFEGKYLIPSLYEGSFPTEGEYNALPAPFVLKASNASGANIFVWKESEKEYHSHYKSIINKRNAFLASTQEKFYHKLDDRFIIEPIFFNNSGSIPEDIKLHTFHGQVRFIQVDLDRFGNHSRNFYSPDWERQDFSFGYKQSEKDANKPVCLDEMVHISETIGRDHDYVRVDLYEYNEAPLFGELTFVHGEGYERFEPRSYDQLWGNLWRNEV